jgi:hypothetical protein
MKSRSKVRWSFGAVIIVVLLMFISSVQGEESMLQGRPVFKLEFSAYGLSYKVDVNGVAVLNEFNPKNQVSVDLPINHWMHPEQSEFKFLIAPEKVGGNFFDGAFIKVALLITDKDDKNVSYRLPLLMFNSKQLNEEKEMAESLAAGSYNLADDNQVKAQKGEIELGGIKKIEMEEYAGALTYSRMMTIPNSLPLWAFFNCDDLPQFPMTDEEYNAFREDLFVEYNKIQDALAAGDTEPIMQLSAARNREIDKAFYYESGKQDKILKEAMLDDINDPEWVFTPSSISEVSITLEDNRKLASLTCGEATNSVGFVHTSGAYNSYPLKFSKMDGKWILTR